ncbi:MAG TPA: hypothetical protein VGP47_08865 [Parachlamydiaceae bacterium]|nr:hypothetical protein [Parachlamydiaceae bacterium]
MRFLLNFFFFGLLFYLIWMFFPDAFLTLVSWADHVVAFFKELIMGMSNKMHHQTPPNAAPAWIVYTFFGR